MSRFINVNEEAPQIDRFGRGFDIHEFRTYEDCDNAYQELEIIVGNIRNQISNANSRPIKNEDEKAWRIRVQDALKYKELALQALKAKMKQLAPAHVTINDVLINLLKQINPTVYTQLYEEAQKRYPSEGNGKELQQRIDEAIDIAFDYGQTLGEPYKLWVIDQMIRKLKGSDEAYQEFVHEYELPADDSDMIYAWNIGEHPP
jgi:hypothetical protein